MTDTKKILDEARQMKPDPPRSKLDDYAEIIWELRRKRKRICAISNFLVGHGLRVGKSTVARWLKAHPAPKANASTPQASHAPVTPEMKKLSDDFFEQPNDQQHEQDQRLYLTNH
jgi:translation initiation factor 1 (eIF-1/SUI1)